MSTERQVQRLTPPLLDCGHVPTLTEGIGTGYARGYDGTTLCYECAKVEVLDAILMVGVGGRDLRVPVIYINMDGSKFTTWDGQELGKVTHFGKRHVWSRDRFHVTGVITCGVDVVNVYGVGAPGEYALLWRRKTDITGHVKPRRIDRLE